MRVFVALDIPEEVREAIRTLIARLEKTCPSARWARVEGMHVTLKFVGEAAPEKVEQIKAALATLRSPAPVEMNFRGAGFFPNEQRPRVFWAGITASPNLAELAAEVEQRMERLGIPREQRTFHPHLTLARFNSPEGLARLHEALRESGSLEFGSTRASELYLYQSLLKPRGAEYTRLTTIRFAGNTE